MKCKLNSHQLRHRRRYSWSGLVALFLCLFPAFVAAQETEKRIAVGLYKSPPFVMIDEDRKPTGMAVDLWERMAEAPDLQTDYVYFDSFKDITTATAEGAVDVAVTNLTITQKRALTVNFTQPWFDAGMRIMVAEQQSGGAGALIRGLSSAGHLKTYGWMLLAIIFATFVVTLFDRRFDPNDPKRWRDGLAEGLYTTMSVATSGKPPSRSKLFGWFGRRCSWSAASAFSLMPPRRSPA